MLPPPSLIAVVLVETIILELKIKLQHMYSHLIIQYLEDTFPSTVRSNNSIIHPH